MDSTEEFPWQGINRVFGATKKAKDLNGAEMNLFKGTYKMDSCFVDVMVRKGDNVNKRSYNLLRSFCHESSIPLLDCYTDPGDQICLVLPEIHGTFKVWLEERGQSLLFDRNGKMTTLLLNMIIEFSDLISSLLKQNLCLENFSLDNVYVKVFKDSPPKLCILLVEVKKVLVPGTVEKNRNWGYGRSFISWCEERCSVTRDPLTDNFCNFIGVTFFTLEKLKLYPHNWNWEMKGKYLMSLIAGNHSDIRFLLDGVNLHWPFQCYGNLPSIIDQLLVWEEKVNRRKYGTTDLLEYAILLRNCFKHYKKFPDHIKAIVPSQKAVIEMVDMLSPEFWTKIYERVGWPKFSHVHSEHGRSR